MLKEIHWLININVEYFGNFAPISLILRELEFDVIKCWNHCESTKIIAKQYNFSEEVEGNGYQTFVNIFMRAIDKIDAELFRMKETRFLGSFSLKKFEKDFLEWHEIVKQLILSFEKLHELHRASGSSLFAPALRMSDFTKIGDNFSSPILAGRHMAFHLHPSVTFAVNLMLSVTGAVHHILFTPWNVFKMFLQVLINFFYPQKRMDNFASAKKNSEMNILKSIWELPETKFFNFLLRFLLYEKVEICEFFSIDTKAMQIETIGSNEKINVPIPISHDGRSDIRCLLISNRNRSGMLGKSSKNAVGPSKFLIFQAHGGGFFAQTCKTPEMFLRDFTHQLDIPICSVDYKLSAFPRGLEDVFYAYCWALKNPEKLGWTGEKIILMGDSAGATIAASCIVKCIEMNIRMPDFAVLIQGFYNMDISLSPSRIYSLLDPVLTDRYIMYIGNFYLTGRNHCRNDDFINECVDLNETKYLHSQHYTSEEILKKFPKVLLVSSDFDVGLDDSVEFGRKLKRVQVDVNMKIFKGVPHGFLNFSKMSAECMKCLKLTIEEIMKFMKSEECENRTVKESTSF